MPIWREVVLWSCESAHRAGRVGTSQQDRRMLMPDVAGILDNREQHRVPPQECSHAGEGEG